jgi:hypothetical protein
MLVIAVPYKQSATFERVQDLLLTEFGKRLGTQASIIGKRRAFPKIPQRNGKYRAIWPVGRTLRSVQEALLQDVVNCDLRGGKPQR